MPQITKQTMRPPPRASANGAASASAWDFTDGLKVLLYGQSASGKTTFWATFPGPILALVCSGGKRPGELRSIDTPENRAKIEARIITSTDQLKQGIEDAKNFATVVVDHVTGVQDLDLKEVLGIDEIPQVKGWGMAQQSQYGEAIRHCVEYCRALLSLPGNVVLVGQERIFGGKEDCIDSDIIRPTVGADVMPSFHRWLAPACDYVVQTFKRPRMVVTQHEINGKKVNTSSRGKGVEYCLRTEAHEVFTTKFRIPKSRVADLPDLIVDPSYAKIMEIIEGKKPSKKA